MRYLSRWSPELAAALTSVALWMWSRQGNISVLLGVMAAVLGGMGVWVAVRHAFRLSRQGKSLRMSRSAAFLWVALLAAIGLVLRLQPDRTESVTAGVFLFAGLAGGLAAASLTPPKS